MVKDNWKEVDPMNIGVWNRKDEDKKLVLKVNDELTGTYLSVEHEVGPNKSNMYLIEKDDGEKIKVWGSHVLDTRFDYIKPGERIKIVFLGTEKAEKSQRSYWNYKVYHSNATNAENEIPVIQEKESTDEGPQFDDDEEIKTDDINV